MCGTFEHAHPKKRVGPDCAQLPWAENLSLVRSPSRVSTAAENREQVRAFYAAAIAAGGTDNGPPGIREIYHPNYYGAFVIGPDEHNIEAVCHAAEA
jgi:hypothetical protein